MRHLEVLAPGLLTTVQDLGRPGFQRFGVPVGGAMDALSLRLANRLVGNPDTAAALEGTLFGGRFLLPAKSMVAITGADLRPTWSVANQPTVPFPQGRPVAIEQVGELVWHRSSAGCRSYLAVSGGIDVPLVMGSRATYPRATLGGWQGRALQTDDHIPLGDETSANQARWQQLANYSMRTGLRYPNWFLPSDSVPHTSPVELRVVLGQHFSELDRHSQGQFFRDEFEITPQSDRMGYRLHGPELTFANSWTMLSAGLVRGTLQLPFGGQPILVMADGAPTGGYPRIAHVISADWPLAGQLRPGERVRFCEVSLTQAHHLRKQAELSFQRKLVGLERHLEPLR